jgi:phosphotransferase system HPr (HPr) family protein
MSTSATAIATIANRLGLHARPAMLLAETAGGFQADVTVRRTDQAEAVDAKSIMQLMMLAAICGTDLEFTANGTDAEQAVADLVALVESRFSEEA